MGHNTDGTPRVVTVAQARVHNRELVQALTTLNGASKLLFVYQVRLVPVLFQDPTHNNNIFTAQNPRCRSKNTLFRSAIFPKAVQIAFFNKNKTLSLGKELPTYFSDNDGLPLVTIAFLATTVRLA